MFRKYSKVTFPLYLQNDQMEHSHNQKKKKNLFWNIKKNDMLNIQK